MADMPRKVKDVIVMILSYNGVALKYLETRKRYATIEVAVRFTYTDAKKKRRRVNAAKVIRVDLTKIAREASKLMSYDSGSEQLEFVEYVGKVLVKLITATKAAERERITAVLNEGHVTNQPINLGNNPSEKVH